MKLYGKQWPQDFTNRFFMGMHMIDRDQVPHVPNVLKGVKPREIVRQLADAGCDTLYFYMSCHNGNCYYPTRVEHGRVHSGMGKRDVFGEVADECVRRKMALCAVYEFMHLHVAKDWDRAPESWKHYIQRPDGTRGVKGLCWNTGYGEFVLAQIDEVFSTYPVAGLYVDMLDHPGLNLCPGCEERYRDDLDKDPPTQDTDIETPRYKEYKMWKFREEARFLNVIKDTVRSHVPGATVLNNHHRLNCEDLYEVRDATDYMSTDPGIGFGYHSMTWSTHTPPIFRAMSEGKLPFDVLYDDVLVGLLEIAPRDPFLSVASVALAHGGYPNADCMWAKDGSLNPAAVGLAREVFSHIKKTKRWVGNWTSLKSAGLYLSQESEFFYGRPGEKSWVKSSRYRDAFDGALMALTQEHVLTDVLTRNQLPRLSDYKIIVLANTVCLSRVEVEAFRDYVRNGGTLVATYKSSLADEWGTMQKDFQLADVFGVHATGDAIDPFLAVQMNVKPDKRFPFLPWENPSVTVNQAALVVKARPGVKVLAHLHDRYRPNTDPKMFSGFHNAFPVEKPAGPAMVENRFGKGRCIYFAPKIFSAYAYKGVPEIRKLATRWAVARERKPAPVKLDAPAGIKLTAFERPTEARWIVHVVNVQTVPTDAHVGNWKEGVTLPITEDVLPVHDLELVLRPGRKTIKQVTLQNPRRKLKIVKRGADTVVKIPKVHIHDIVVVEFDRPWKGKPERFTTERLVPMKHCPKATRRRSGRKARTAKQTSAPSKTAGAWDGLGEGQAG